MNEEFIPDFYSQNKERMLSYLASLVDQKGSFMIHSAKKANKRGLFFFITTFTLDSRYEEVVCFFKEFFDGTVSKLKKSKTEGYHEWKANVWEWKVHGKNLENFIETILPYLIIKKEECTIMIEARKTYKGIVSTRGVPLTVFKERLILEEEMRKVKKRKTPHVPTNLDELIPQKYLNRKRITK